MAWPYVAPYLNIPASYRVSKQTMALGASGAINAVVAWSIFTFPTRMIYIYMVLPVPAVSKHADTTTRSPCLFLPGLVVAARVPHPRGETTYEGVYGSSRATWQALVGVLYLVKDLSGLYRGGSGEANAGETGRDGGLGVAR